MWGHMSMAADSLSGNSFAVSIRENITSEFYRTSAQLLNVLTPAGDGHVGGGPAGAPEDAARARVARIVGQR
jgi:hypothetical protein